MARIGHHTAGFFFPQESVVFTLQNVFTFTLWLQRKKVYLHCKFTLNTN